MKLPIYCIIGDRPVKAIQTKDGGMDVLALDWTTGEFQRAMQYTHTVVSPMDEDVEFVNEKQFNETVEKLRREIKK